MSFAQRDQDVPDGREVDHGEHLGDPALRQRSGGLQRLADPVHPASVLPPGVPDVAAGRRDRRPQAGERPAGQVPAELPIQSLQLVPQPRQFRFQVHRRVPRPFCKRPMESAATTRRPVSRACGQICTRGNSGRRQENCGRLGSSPPFRFSISLPSPWTRPTRWRPPLPIRPTDIAPEAGAIARAIGSRPGEISILPSGFKFGNSRRLKQITFPITYVFKIL